MRVRQTRGVHLSYLRSGVNFCFLLSRNVLNVVSRKREA